MRSRDAAPGGELVAFDNRVGDFDMNVRKRTGEFQVERLEAGRPAQVGVRLVPQPMGDGILSQQSVDGQDLLFVPHLLEPFMRETLGRGLQILY